jgi:excinuclease ABC subunit A
MAKHSHIEIYGAKQHNLKGIDVKIPKNKLVVITGVSGSGKTSLAFDTLYAEGQRRYIESLSSYARQFLGKIDKPQVDKIVGLTPSIAIEQKVISTNARSTVGTSTEIYDFLKLLYARVGKTISPISGSEVKKNQTSDVLNHLDAQEEGQKIAILTKIPENKINQKYQSILISQGYSKIFETNSITDIDDWKFSKDSFLVIDRFKNKKGNEDFKQRIAESIELAFFEGNGALVIQDLEKDSQVEFNNRFELDGIEFMEPSTDLFSSNSPVGSCPNCQGYGKSIGLDKALIFPNPTKSIYEGAIAFSEYNGSEDWKKSLFHFCNQENISIHKPYLDFSKQEKEAIWQGGKGFSGIKGYFEYLESNAYKIQNRILLSRFRGKTECNSCEGKKLRKEALYVWFENKNISDLLELPIEDLYKFFKGVDLASYPNDIAQRIITEILNRLETLLAVGLPYLTLTRPSNTLSGGESQRIRLANSLNSSLVSSTYVLDEPSIGLHSHDTKQLIKVLKGLRDLGNTVVVVEHDEEMMEASDYIIDIGKDAGVHGGSLLFSGTYEELLEEKDSYTADYLNGKIQLTRNQVPAGFVNFIELFGATENNLQGLDVKIPTKALTVVSGMSGSGKSTLVRKILLPAIQRSLDIFKDKPGKYSDLKFDNSIIQGIEFVDQNPIGKSSRSNPVTYLKAFDAIRNLLAKNKLSVQRGYKTKHFSFNIPGGRCETCQGEGEIQIEMQFLSDIKVLCEDCKGKRYQDEILDIEFEGKNISDILGLTVNEALEFFETHNQKKIVQNIRPLQEVGLGYVQLGQSSSTLSGGEAQRVKLASFLAQANKKEKNLLIFDEPTTGLHFKDIQNLLNSFDALIKNGHTIVVVEHHPDIIKLADWNIDLGPMGGNQGGQLVFEGENADFLEFADSLTVKYLSKNQKEVL